MKYSWIFIIHFSKYFYVMQPKTIVKLGAGMGAGREGQINHYYAWKCMFHTHPKSVIVLRCECYLHDYDFRILSTDKKI